MLLVGLVVFSSAGTEQYITKQNKSQVKSTKKEDEMEKFYDCKQVAAHYGVKIKTVWDWIRAGKLKAFRVGKQYRIPKEALAEFEKSK